MKRNFAEYLLKMKMGIYGRQLEQIMTQSVRNRLIVIDMLNTMPAGSLMAFSLEPLTEALLPGIPAPIIARNRIFELFGNSAERELVLPKLLRKQKIDTLIVFDIRDVLAGSINQFLILSDQYRPRKKDNKVFQKLKGIIVSTALLKKCLQEETGIPAEKIIVLPGFLRRNLKPAGIPEITAFKDTFTERKEFFICNDETWTKDKLVVLLKAFSRFKKMQQTNWKLLITQRGADPRATFRPVFDVLGSYRYKEDIVLFECAGDEAYAQALSAAYMAVSLHEGPAYPAGMMEALCCGTPVIIPETLENSTGVLLPVYSGNDDESLGKMMMEQYKNERLRHNYTGELERKPVTYNLEENRSIIREHLLPA